MEATDLTHFLAISLMAPLGTPFMLILVDQWRISQAALFRRAAAILLLYIPLCLAVGVLSGFSRTGGFVITFLSLLLFWSTYAAATRFRDGRFLFTVVTVAVLCSLTETVCNFFFPYGSVRWIILKAAITVLLSLVLFFVCREPFLHMLRINSVAWLRMSVIPFSLLLCLVMASTLPSALGAEWINQVVSIVLCASIPIIYVSLYHMLRSVEAEYRARQDSAVLLSKLEYLDQQTQRLMSNERKNSIFRHDLRHHIRLLEARLLCGDCLGAQALLGSMEEALTRLSQSSILRSYTGNALLDTVFSLCADKAEELGVEFTVRLTLPAALPVDMTELAVVVSNALENAAAACRSLPKGSFRAIRVYDAPAASQFFLAIDNTCPPSVHLDPDTGLPISNRPGHGYGTQSITAFAQKYGAVLTYSVDNGWFRLRLLI